MASKLSTLSEDFGLPGLDISKWSNPGSVGDYILQAENVGLKLIPRVAYEGTIRTLATYDMTSTAATSTAPATTNNAYARIDSMPASASIDSAMYVGDSTGSTDARIAIIVVNGTIYFRSRNNGAGWTTHYSTTYNSSIHKWWRIYTYGSSTQFYFAYSSDGFNWTRKGPYSIPSDITPTAVYLWFSTGGANSTTPFTVRYLNTRKPLLRPGFLRDDFNAYPIMTIPQLGLTPPLQFGRWGLINTTGATIIADPRHTSTAHKLLRLTNAAGSVNLRSATKTKIKNVDFSVSIRLNSYTGPLSDLPGPRINWRATSDNTSMYELTILPSAIVFGRRIADDYSEVARWGITSDALKFYRYRVIHSGSTIVVYRDGGEGSATEGRPEELFRLNDPVLPLAGNVWLGTYNADAYFDDVVVNPGVLPAISALAAPMNERLMGAWVATGDRSLGQVGQTDLTENVTVMSDLETQVGREMDIASWFFYTGSGNMVPNPYFRTSASDWNNDSNAVLARSTAQARTGAASLSLTSIGAGDVIAASPYLVDGNCIPATAGTSYTVTCYVRSAVSARSARVQLSWRKADGTAISGSNSANVTTTTSGWTKITLVATAPALTAYVIVKPSVLSTGGASEVHYFDDFILRPTTVTSLHAAWPAAATTFANQGKHNLVSWEFYGVDFEEILAGTWDANLDTTITSVKATPGLVYMRLFPEFNGEWTPWSFYYDYYGSDYEPMDDCNVASIAQWKLVWQYIVNRFAAQSATNVRWVFNPIALDDPADLNTPELYYPGDAYVDVFGIDGYNWGERPRNGKLWLSHKAVFLNMYSRATAIASKDIWVCETGVAEPLYYRNNFEMGSDGTTVTTVNSAATDQDAWDAVSGGVTYTPISQSGALGGKFTHVTTTEAYVEKNWQYDWTTATPTTREPYISFQVWFRTTSTPTGVVDLVSGYNGGSKAWSVRMEAGVPDFVLSVADSTGSSIGGSVSPDSSIDFPTLSLNNGDWYRLDGQIRCSTTAGESWLRLFDASGNLLNAAQSDANNNIPLCTKVRFGVDSTVSESIDVYMDGIVLSPDGFIMDYDAGDWIADAMADRTFPAITAWVWFLQDRDRDWRFDSSPEKLAAAITALAGTPGFDPSDPQVQPEGWSANAQASPWEYCYFEDDRGNKLNIMPSYGDISLVSAEIGSPTARQVLEAKPMADGARSYTRFHGEKAVSMRLKVLRTDLAETSNWVDLVRYWTLPGRSCRLVYKPRGSAERYINLNGTEMGTTVDRLGRLRQFLDVSFVAPDGADYEVAEKSLTIDSGDSRDATNYGGLRAEPVIKIYGPATNPIIYNDTWESTYGTNARLGLTLVIDDGDYVELDTRERTVRLNGFTDEAANYRQYLTTRDWFALDSFDNSLRLESEETTTTAQAVVTWKDKY